MSATSATSRFDVLTGVVGSQQVVISANSLFDERSVFSKTHGVNGYRRALIGESLLVPELSRQVRPQCCRGRLLTSAAYPKAILKVAVDNKNSFE